MLKAFKEPKSYLGRPPLLSRPKKGEELKLYLTVFDHAISVVLVREVKVQQRAMYYVSRVILVPQMRYTKTKQLILALMMVAQKLRPYFEAHVILVLTNLPLCSIMA